MKQVVAYARMSTEDQALSVEGQFAAIELAAAANGWEIVARFADQGVSGSVDPLERAQCRLALAMSSGLKCPVVVHRVDRMARDHSHYVALQKKYDVIEADDPSSNKLIKNIKSLLAEEELSKIRQRTTDALAVLKQRADSGDAEALAKVARRDAGREAAWEVGNGAAMAAKAKNANARAASMESHIKACLFDKHTSFGAVARCLNERGIKTERGGVFQPMTVKRLMERLNLSFP